MEGKRVVQGRKHWGECASVASAGRDVDCLHMCKKKQNCLSSEGHGREHSGIVNRFFLYRFLRCIGVM